MKHALSLALIAGATLAAPAFGGDDFRLGRAQPEAELADVDPIDRWAVREDSWVRFRGAAWFADLSGEADFEDDDDDLFGDGGGRSSVDFEDDLGLDDGEIAAMLMLGFNFGNDWHFNIGWTGPLDFEGSVDDADFTIDGTDFSGDVDGEFRLNIIDLEVLYDITDPEPVTWAIGGGVKIFVVDIKVEGELAGDGGGDGEAAIGQEEAEGVVPVPVLSTLLRWDLGRNFYVQGTAAGMYAGDYGILLDLAAEAGFDLNRHFGIFGGYRYLRAEADLDDESDEFEATIHGPYVGAELRF